MSDLTDDWSEWVDQQTGDEINEYALSPDFVDQGWGTETQDAKDTKAAAVAAFVFADGQVRVSRDENDNPDGGYQLIDGAGVMALIDLANVGSAEGEAEVDAYVDGTHVKTETFGPIAAGTVELNCRVGLGRLASGTRQIDVVVRPGGQGATSTTNTVEINRATS